MNLQEFHAICKSGQPKIVADWLEDLDDEYYTEIAMQLRRQHGEWLLRELDVRDGFNCRECHNGLGYGFIFIDQRSLNLPKSYKYKFLCYKCRDLILRPYNYGNRNIKCKAC